MEIVDNYDKAIEILRERCKGKPEFEKEVEKLAGRRKEVIEAALTGRRNTVIEILRKAAELEKRMAGIGVEKTVKKEAKPKEEIKPPVKVEKEEAPPKVVKEEIKPKEKALDLIPKELEKFIERKEELEKKPELIKKKETISLPEKISKKPELTEEEVKWDEKRLKEIEEEFRKIMEEARKIEGGWEEIETLEGDYSKLEEQVKKIKKEVDVLVEKKKDISMEIAKIKRELEKIHLRKNQEFGLTKKVYQHFWNELLGVSVKLMELEELLERKERITETDLFELQKNVQALERKLGAIVKVAREQKKLSEKLTTKLKLRGFKTHVSISIISSTLFTMPIKSSTDSSLASLIRSESFFISPFRGKLSIYKFDVPLHFFNKEGRDA